MLELAGLRKRFGEVVALDGLSFGVAPGEMVGFLGPNGAGKTTAMRAVFDLVRLDAGEVTWRGRAIDEASRLRFGYMPEERGLYPRMRVAEQIAYFGRLHGLAPAEAAAATTRWLERLGLADRAGSRLEELSHGNQQRVQLAAALVHDPEVLVLDEPFSGLDPLGVADMAAVLSRRAAAGTAVVFSSHQLDLVEDLCERVVIVHHGRTVLEGEVRRLRASLDRRYLEAEVIDGGRWWEALPDVEPIEVDGTRVRLAVPATFDLAVAAAAARRSGTVVSFAFVPPRLSEVFREVAGP